MTAARRLLALAVLCALLAGCAPQTKQVERTVFAMDTVLTLTVCGTDRSACQTAADRAVTELYALDKTLSATGEDSFVWALNHAAGAWVQPPETWVDTLLENALTLCAETGGALDLTAYPAVQAWGFPSGEYRVPDRTELEQLASRIDYRAVERSERQGVRLPEGMELDFGAVAKGYAGDALAAWLRETPGVTSALLNLGQSSIQTIGERPGGGPWRIAIQDPSGEGALGVLTASDCAIGTSGGYQRYFESDGQTYWHILDPETAAPARSGLASVTVVSPSGLTSDGLSTALFVMGREDAVAWWRERQDFDVLLVEEDGSISLTPGLAESFTPSDPGREVNVLS